MTTRCMPPVLNAAHRDRWSSAGCDGGWPKHALTGSAPPTPTRYGFKAIDVARNGPAGRSHHRTAAVRVLAADHCAADKSP